MDLRSLACVVLWFAATACAHAQAMYQTPKGALEFRHVALQPGVYEQDSFFLEEEYPSMFAIEHYERMFAKWRACTSGGPKWQSFGDVSGSEPRFIHQLVRHWVSPRNDTVVTVALRYASAGAQYRVAPDNTRQNVIVLRHKTKDAKSEVAQVGGACG